MSEADRAEVRRWYSATGHAHICVLRWYRTVGYAHYGCTRRWLHQPPGIDGSDIEYLGGHSGRIDGRDMTPDEVATVRRLLVRMDTGAGDGIEGRCTLAVVLDAPATTSTN